MCSRPFSTLLTKRTKKDFLVLFVIMFCSVVYGQKIKFTEEEKKWIKDHPIIEFGYEPQWKPYELYENGEYQGIVGEYVKIVERETGIDLVPIPGITWSESINGLKEGKINFVPSCAITPLRKEFLEFTEVYINDPMIIVTRRDYPFVNDLSNFHGKKVCTPKNYYTGEMIKSRHPEVKLYEFESIEQCLEEVSYGNMDAFVENIGVASYYISSRGFNNLKIAAPTNFADNGIAMAVTKDWGIFKDILDKVLKSISEKEQFEIRSKWVTVDYEDHLSGKELITYSIITISIILVLLIGFYYWNRTLRRQIILRKESEEQLKDYLDILTKQNEEKKVLLQEIHHRVKNNLQIITSMLRLQSNKTKSQAATQALGEAIERIKSISLIHEKIYQSPSLEEIDLKDYVQSLSEELIRNFSHNKEIDLIVSTNKKMMKLESLVPLALILNELITNSLKYGFKDKSTGQITVDCLIESKHMEMTYFDNGQWIEASEGTGFGTTLIEIFTEQLDGEFVLHREVQGTTYVFKFHGLAELA